MRYGMYGHKEDGDGSPWLYAQSIDSVSPVADDEFIVGDVVELVTGSPNMVVIGVCDCGSVEVAWYDDHHGLNIEQFPEEALVDV